MLDTKMYIFFTESIASMSTYDVIERHKTYVVIKWNEARTTLTQLIVSLMVKSRSIAYNTYKYTTFTNNTDYIVIKNLKPYDIYKICFSPTPLRGNRKSYCLDSPRTFQAAEGGKNYYNIITSD